MKPSKKTEKEVLQVYDTWLRSYITGDVETYDQYLDKEYHFIGSTNNEEFLPKKETTQFFRDTAEQFAGKTDLRNESRVLEEFASLVFITHFFDAWFLNGGEWSYYGRFRFSSVARRNEEGWRFIYQHFSMPDARAEEGETIGYDQISAENLQLREAIKRRTIELEQKNRELEIETALERVRAKTMAMHKSEDLAGLSQVLVKQVQALGVKTWFCAFNIYDEDGEGSLEWGSNGEGTFPRYRTPREGIFLHYYEEGQKGKTLLINEIKEDICASHYEYLCSLPGVGEQLLKMRDEGIPFPTSQIDHVAYFKYGYIIFITYEPAPESHDIFKRFARVFEQTYTRFLDLQQAEARARESQIETALERVRSRTMGMQKSEELKDVVKAIFDQLANLDINAEHAGIVVDYEPKKDWHFWVAETQDIPAKITLPYLDLVWDRQFTEAKREGKDFFTTQLDFDEKNSFYSALLPHIEGLTKKAKDFYFNCAGLAISTVIQKDIGLYIENFTGTPYSRDENEILMRFAVVFQQTYTRFLDLQKAEAQAREARIEAALEKVRSRTMAMQRSDELPEAANLLFLEIQALGIPAWSCGYNILSEDKKSAECWMSSEGALQEPFTLRLWGEASFEEMGDFVRSDESFLVQELGGKAIDDHYNHMKSFPDLLPTFEAIEKQGLSLPTYQINHLCRFNQGFLLFITYEPVPQEHDLFKRFTTVFEQTYTRFLDLQQAEARARESQIETALERVRSRTMGMQRSDELGDVATVLFKELNRLVDNLWTCGFVLCEEGRDEDEWWLSAENGFIPAFFLPNVGDITHNNIYNAWKNGADYHTEQLEGEALQEHYDWLMKIPVAKQIFDDMRSAGIEIPTWQKLHCAFFKTGYLVIITQVPCPEEEIFKRFAQAFDLTYTRFLDLQLKETQARKLAEDKEQLERTLSDLRATQAQLIQSEKMASLGELTAGIAHEIQNPLNFVNNFSEVSKELIEEMLEEIQRGDMEEAKALAEDIVQNLEKIHHHGQRADGIVKGMLQHSRSGSGEKEPTDINILADEYLRLAYHGLRAKDKSFNATLETHFDPDVGKVNVVAQEIGRVILNLITNAFYAVREKKQKEGVGHTPTVTVTTRKKGDGVEVSVRDNGEGIPEVIREKIFQPFFTTKPTGQGTGLGLSMSYDIVTKGHHGELLVTSEEGVGTTFTVVLPIGKKEVSKKRK